MAISLTDAQTNGQASTSRKGGFLRWTIGRKMIALGVISVFGLCALGGIAILSANQVRTATTVSEKHQHDALLVNEMLRQQLVLVLAAMDSIIDKDEGAVAPERLSNINEAVDFLKTKAVHLGEAAETPAERQLAVELGQQIDILATGIQTDLVKAIATAADAAEFARLDDVIDENGEAVETILQQFQTSLEKEALDALIAAKAAAGAAEKVTYIALLVSVVVLTVLIALIGRSIVTPVKSMTGAMRHLADGKLDVEIPARGHTDEIGEMAETVQVFKDNAIEKVRLEKEQDEKDRRAAEEKRRTMEKMADDFETSVGRVVDQVSSAATEMEASSQSMNMTAEEATQQSAAVAAASEQASANVQTVASAAEELSSSISEISRQVGKASEIATGAVRQAEQTNTKIQGLAEAAQKIGEVVALITDIADQTNLLALNATIEAARAGDAGKGFAVVASEVKNLANQTAKATDEIGTQIAGIQTATQDAVDAIEAITRTITEISEVNSSIASAVEEQGAATQEIARNVEQAAAGTQEVNTNISGVSRAANDTGAAAQEIRSAAGELSQQSELLRSEVGKFLANVRTA